MGSSLRKSLVRKVNLDVEVDFLSQQELKEILFDRKLNSWRIELSNQKNDYGIRPFEGFTFFGPSNFEGFFSSSYFLAAFLRKDSSSQEIAGVGSLTYQYGGKKPFWYMNYLDIGESFKRKGVASRINFELGNLLDSSDVLVCSREVGEGKSAGTFGLVKTFVTSCSVYSGF